MVIEMQVNISYQSKFLPILEELIIKDKPHELDTNTISVTEVTQCLRKSFLNRKGVKPVISKELFEGKSIHSYIEHLLKEHRKDIESEQEYIVDVGLLCKIVMKPDIVMDDRVVELKTTDVSKLYSPYPEHILQVNFYAFTLNKQFYEIVYIRRRQPPVVFVDKPDWKLFFHMLRRIELYHRYLIQDTLPDMETKYCNRCPYYHYCFHQAKLDA